MRKKLIKLDRKKLVTMMALSFMLSAVFVLQIGFPVLAAENDGSTVIQTGFNTIYGLIAAIVSSIGSLYLLWGVFEWAQSMNSQDGGAQVYGIQTNRRRTCCSYHTTADSSNYFKCRSIKKGGI